MLLLGRDDLLLEFDHLLRRYPVVEVAGPSGVGKSSFVGAGLCGRLDRDRQFIVRSFAAWSMLPASAGTVFYAEAVLGALQELGAPDPAAAEDGVVPAPVVPSPWQPRIDAFLADPAVPLPKEDPIGFVHAVNDALGDRLVLVFDQVEELLRDDPYVGRLFLKNVRETAAIIPGGFTQVVSLREEFLGHLRIIEESLDPSLWRLKVVGEVSAAHVADIVTIPLELHPELEVSADATVIKAVVDLWALARPQREVTVREVLDESRPGLLHLQAFLHTMWAVLDPVPGATLDAATVAAGLEIRWPADETTAVQLLADVLERYVKLELSDRRREHTAPDPADSTLAQQALETTRTAALLPDHLSSGTYKLPRHTDDLAATVLTQLRDLHRQLTPEERQAEADRLAAGQRPHYPAGMSEGYDMGKQVRAFARTLALKCRVDPERRLDAAHLARAAVTEYAGLASWGDPTMIAGRLLGPSEDDHEEGKPSAALVAACEVIVTYERSLRWLEASGILRMTLTRNGGRMAAIVHDGFGSALIGWSSTALDEPKVAVALPVAVAGKQIFHRPEVLDDATALGPAELPYTDGLGWIGCNVTAFFDGVTFRNCDFRSTLFAGCRFRGVVFEDCVTHGLLFLECTFEGGFTIRSTGDASARRDAAMLRTLSFGRGCVAVDQPIVLEGFSGYGAFFDDLAGPWEVRRSSFSHLVVLGNTKLGAGPGAIVDSAELSHVRVAGHHPHEIVITGQGEPSYLEAPGVVLNYHSA
jgi:hypothetical protein